ncbi:MAG: efflux RND transporter periplasmic adaptor subunit [Sulfurovaceae bacterium]|nr:efflux RND transporter periplasmic adaptor subunit [Sulfurovaceae bacterium]
MKHSMLYKFNFILPSKKKKFLNFVMLITAATMFINCNGNNQSAKNANAPIEVGIYTIKSKSITLQQELPGRTKATLSSEVRPQIGGIIQKQLFSEGGEVKKGDILYIIDPTKYKAAYDEANAAYKNAQAAIEASRLKDRRYKELVKVLGVSKQDYEDAHTAYLQAKATAEEKKAAMESASINLGYTQIKAPISGRIGISSVTEGTLVTPDQTIALATIRTLDPIYVDFTQSSVQVLNLKRLLQQKAIHSGSTNVRLKLENDVLYEHNGTLKLQEVAVDEATGSVTLRAEFSNPENILLPGMYVKVIVDEAVNTHAILAPQQGISRDPKGEATALVVSRGDKVEQRNIIVDRTIGDQWLVKSGLKENDRLIVEGLNKIKIGDIVHPVDISPKLYTNKPKSN